MIYSIEDIKDLLLNGISKEEWIKQTGMSVRTRDRLRRELGLTRKYRQFANSQISRFGHGKKYDEEYNEDYTNL